MLSRYLKKSEFIKIFALVILFLFLILQHTNLALANMDWCPQFHVNVHILQTGEKLIMLSTLGDLSLLTFLWSPVNMFY